MQLTANGGEKDFFLPKLFVNLLGSRSQARIRRIIFVFSVLAAIDRRYGHDDKKVDVVNEHLRIAQNTSMCRVSAKAGSKIWKGGHGGNVCDKAPALTHRTSKAERGIIADFYIRNCPDWIRYGDKNGLDMHRDLMRLFTVVASENQ